MSPRTKRASISLVGALAITAIGISLNWLVDLSQDWVLFPTSLLFNRVPDLVEALRWHWLSEELFRSDTYPPWFRGATFAAHLLIWTAIIYGFLAVLARRRNLAAHGDTAGPD